MEIKLLIVDDEPLAHNVLERYCKKIEYVSVVGNCYDGMSTLNFLNKNDVDAILLDIQMPDLTGLELLDTLNTNGPKVILTTAFTEFAIEGFNFEQVIDYLHKPIRIGRFIKSIERLKKQLTIEKQFAQKRTTRVNTEINEFITVVDNKITHKIRFDDISYIQSWGNYLKVITCNEKIFVARKTIKNMEKELPQNKFIRIHKSYIINITRVTSVNGNQAIISDIIIPIGKSYSIQAKKIILGIS